MDSETLFQLLEDHRRVLPIVAAAIGLVVWFAMGGIDAGWGNALAAIALTIGIGIGLRLFAGVRGR